MTPTPAADSYGTPEGVAALASSWTMEGEWLDADVYTASTQPTLTTVVSWIDQVSAMLNNALKNYGFVVPLTNARNVLDANFVVNGVVSELARYANNREQNKPSMLEVMKLISDYLNSWVLEYAPGIETNGDPRTGAGTRIGFRSFDENGDEVFPLFQRKEYGNPLIDWVKRFFAKDEK